MELSNFEVEGTVAIIYISKNRLFHNKNDEETYLKYIINTLTKQYGICIYELIGIHLSYIDKSDSINYKRMCKFEVVFYNDYKNDFFVNSFIQSMEKLCSDIEEKELYLRVGEKSYIVRSP